MMQQHEVDIATVRRPQHAPSAGGDNEVQRTMLEIVNQLDGFDSRGNIKVRPAGFTLMDAVYALSVSTCGQSDQPLKTLALHRRVTRLKQQSKHGALDVWVLSLSLPVRIEDGMLCNIAGADGHK